MHAPVEYEPSRLKERIRVADPGAVLSLMQVRNQ